MGHNYIDLLHIISNIYFAKNENQILDTVINIFKNNKNLDLNIKYFCSKIKIINLVTHREYSNVLELIIKYDKTQITQNIINTSFYKNNYVMNYKLLNQYKINISNKHEYIKLLKKLLRKSIILNNNNNFKLVCNEIYKIKNKISYIHKVIKPYKHKKNNNHMIKLLINYPSICLPFKRTYNYPKEIQDIICIIYKIDIPEELINIICNYYISDYYIY